MYFDKIVAMSLAMIMSLRHILGWAVSAFSSRERLVLENPASVGYTPRGRELLPAREVLTNHTAPPVSNNRLTRRERPGCLPIVSP